MIRNNAKTYLVSELLTDSTSFVCKQGEGDLFPTENFEIFIESFEKRVCIKRESIFISSRTGDVFNIGNRVYDFCVQNDGQNPRNRTKNTLEFPIGSKISQYISEKKLKNIDDDISSLKDNKVSKNDTTYTQAGNIFNGPGQLVKTDGSGKIDSNLINSPGVSNFVIGGLVAGEDLLALDSYRKGNIGIRVLSDSQLEAISDWKIGYSTTQYSLRQYIDWKGGTFSKVKIKLGKNGTPNQEWRMHIYNTTTGDHFISNNTINTTNIPNGGQDVIFEFNNSYLQASTTIRDCYFELELVSGGTSTSNNTKFFYKNYNSLQQYCLFFLSQSWTLQGFNGNKSRIYYEIYDGTKILVEDPNKKYKAKNIVVQPPYVGKYNNAEGIVIDDVSANSTFNGNVFGVQGGYTGLTPGQIYYLESDGTISTSPTSTKIGKAISETELFIINNLYFN